MQQLEYVWCMDTMNRVKKSGDQLLPNPTNDITIKPQLSVNRMTIHSIELATLELPRVQRLIEPEWSRVYTYDGFQIQGDNTLVIQDSDKTYTAALPVTFNPLDDVTIDVGNGTIEFKATYNHLLDQTVTTWADASQAIQLVGLPIPGASPVFEILDETRFRTAYDAAWATNPTITDSEINAVTELYHPPLPSPEFVALAVTNSLNKSFKAQNSPSVNAFKVTFDTSKSRYTIKIHSNAIAMFSQLKNTRIVSGGLVAALGFNDGILFINQPDGDLGVVASDLPYGTKYVQLDAGDYKSTQLAAEIQRASNSTYFPVSTTPYQLSVGIDGVITTIILPPGMYTPATLAATITQLFVSIAIELKWHATDAVYTFKSMSGFVFSLEFTPDLTNIANQLGFNPFRYSCATEYESTVYTNPQQLRGSSTTYGTTICQVEDDVSAQKITFYISRPGPVLSQTSTPTGNVLAVTSTTAHGYQVGDVVQLTTSTSKTYLLRVSQWGDGLTFEALCAPLPSGSTVESTQFPVGPTTSVFLSPNNDFALKPSIIGFGQYDFMWAGQSSLQSPFTYRLQASTYVLLEMVYPHGSAHIEHRNGGDNRTTILGKIVTLPHPFLDRFYPMKASFFTGIRLDYFQFRLLNPDHSLYKLHGHDWQATFRLYAVDLPLE